MPSNPDSLIRVIDARKEFYLRGWRWGQKSRKTVFAVDGVDLDIQQGEILGLVGESGSGKTTLGLLIVGLQELSQGQILFRGEDVQRLLVRDQKSFRRKVQIVFQDPYESLNPRQTVQQAIEEPLRIHGIGSSATERWALVHEMLLNAEISTPQALLDKYPHELSGGLRQRVAIARSMILGPEFVVADEPVSMLDVSIRAGVLNLMLKFNRKEGLAILFITHDLAVARYVSNRIAVMYLGKIVEVGETDGIIDNPLHPYTRALLAVVPTVKPSRRIRQITLREIEWDERSKPSGCNFYPRCPFSDKICKEAEPALLHMEGRSVACHLLASKPYGSKVSLTSQVRERAR